MPDAKRRPPTEFDVFVSCADEPEAEIPSTVAAYLTRAGFHVRVGGPTAGPGAEAAGPALVEESPDFILLLTPATVDALADRSHAVYAQVERALSTGRNVVCVVEGPRDSAPRLDLRGEMARLADEPPVGYDRDRLAESLSILRHRLSSEPTVNERRDMRRARRWAIFAVLFVLAGFSWQTVPMLVKAWRKPKPLPPVAPFTLYWTCFAERTENGRPVEFQVQPGIVVSGGERVRVAFSPSADGFAYVIAKDARGRVSVLFPTEVVRDASRVRAGRVYSAPTANEWLTVDGQNGLDTIYVFGSLDPLQNLEELVEEPESPTAIGARRALVDETIAGLLDGRHYQYGRRVSVRTTALVDQSLTPAPGPAAFSVTGSGGATLTHAALAEAGLVSALAEIKVRFVPAK